MRESARLVTALALVLWAFAAVGLSITAASAAGGGEEQGASSVEPHYYVRLDAITVTLFDEDSVVGLYTVLPTLEIADDAQRLEVSAKKSRLRDAMITELHALVARRKSSRIPLDAVKRHLRAVAQRTLGKEVVIDLFVENVLLKES